MASTKTKKKTNRSKKTSKKNNVKKTNKNIMIIVGVVIITIIIVLAILLLTKDNTISCKKINPYDKGVKQSNNINISFSRNDIKKISTNKSIEVIDEYKKDSSSYLKVIEESLKSAYMDKDVSYNSIIEKDKLKVNINYNNKKKYILDDIDILLENGDVSINVISVDSNNNRVVIDLSKENTKKDIINLLKTKKYVCK